MLKRRIEELKRDTSHIIIGAYLAGAGKDVAAINPKTKVKTLGESFCNYNAEKPLDFVNNPFLNLNNRGSAPVASGVISSLISQCNSKLDERGKFFSSCGIPFAEAIEVVERFARKLQQASAVIAQGEGVLDNDLKEDIRTLLKEAKNEFIKREEEESVPEDVSVPEGTELPEEDMGIEKGGESEEPVEDFTEDIVEDEEELNGDGIEENTDVDDSGAAEEDFDIPSGKEESFWVDKHGKVTRSEDINSFLQNRFKSEEEANRIAVAESFNISEIYVMNDKEFGDAIKKVSDSLPYAEGMNYLYKGNIIHTTPFDMDNMIKELQIVESASIKMLGESFKMSNVISDDELSNRHKNVVNELAVVIAGRNRFGFR